MQKTAYLKYSNNYLIVIQDKEITRVHVSEIDTIIIESLQITLSVYLINKLIEEKINIVLCDDQHNPNSIISAIYGSFDSSGKLSLQINWKHEVKGEIWKNIIRGKILNQIATLKNHNILDPIENIISYYKEVNAFDRTNRERLSAKLYFRYLYGKGFCRRDDSGINTNMNYAYAILLSYFSRTITAKGYHTSIGIKHEGKNNNFNLASDLMEPFRPIVDNFILENKDMFEDEINKNKLLELHNIQVNIDNKEQYLSNAIEIYTTSIFKCMEKEDLSYMKLPSLLNL